MYIYKYVQIVFLLLKKVSYCIKPYLFLSCFFISFYNQLRILSFVLTTSKKKNHQILTKLSEPKILTKI